MSKYKSDVSRSVHKGVEELHKLGIVDQETMRRFDKSCLTPVDDFTPDQLKSLREREKASQAVLAMHLGVSVATVSQWERGQRKPYGAALKLLGLAKAKGLAHIR